MVLLSTVITWLKWVMLINWISLSLFFAAFGVSVILFLLIWLHVNEHDQFD